MEPHLALMIVILVIACFGLILAGLSYSNSGSLKSSLSQFETASARNQTQFQQTITNSINQSLQNFTEKSIGNINVALDNSSKILSASLTTQDGQITSIQQNVTSLKSDFVGLATTTEIQGVNANVSTLPNIINADVNASLVKRLANLSFGSRSGLTNNTIRTWTMEENITPGNYIVYGLPDTFLNNIKINSSTSVAVTLLDIFQYANFSEGKVYSNEGVYSSSGRFNSVSFTETLSEGCSLYLLVISGNPPTNIPITIMPNITSELMPSAHTTGVCS